jgi:hypothetical protein
MPLLGVETIPDSASQTRRHRRGDGGGHCVLCSGEALDITGQMLFVDGGRTLYLDFRTAWSSE